MIIYFLFIGYCSICNKLEDTKHAKQNYIKIGKMFTNEIVSPKDASIKPIEKELSPTRVLRYKRYSCLDLCGGKLSKKYKICHFWETLCYFPIWCLLISIIIFLSSLTTIAYLSYLYVTSTQIFKSYLESCDSTVNQCNGNKGLVCKTNSSRGVYEESCNCPALGVVNTCDCSSSQYWNGLICSPVYSYGEVLFFIYINVSKNKFSSN
jgi:hypothetical protein